MRTEIKEKWDDVQLKALDDSILLWGWIGRERTRPLSLYENIQIWKQLFATELGLGDLMFGCPLCEAFLNVMGPCGNCPIRIKHGRPVACENDWDHPYRKIVDRWNDEDKTPTMSMCRVFIRYLQDLRDEGARE